MKGIRRYPSIPNLNAKSAVAWPKRKKGFANLLNYEKYRY